jgi:hypothetical protein
VTKAAKNVDIKAEKVSLKAIKKEFKEHSAALK